MNKVRIGCPKCGETITISYPNIFGHALAEEALAIDYATRKHICPTYQERMACQSQDELK